MVIQQAQLLYKSSQDVTPSASQRFRFAEGGAVLHNHCIGL